ncbi:VanB family Oxidoreductase/oxygenase BbdH (plasmid) [Aminobacter sp. MSH1]|uniref:PDR/VanB family oxidoreductase n=1 Tax=Aminobacter sp. MSH1 TaxID=374606 RepID=UPI0009DC78D2|nr:PDR/VanB family oxidoreductase [Aminobacter sp. MSH1]ARD70019.1 VanB family Oxidoreductase/oxygenase BbdH [Aminobacter sp. MSH1]
MSLMNVRVEEIADEAEDIRSFTLVSVEGGQLPPAEPGSHINVHIPGGPVRQYSICGHAADTSRYVIAVKKEPNSRGGSVGMHNNVRVGDVIRIDGPRNNFKLVDGDGEALLVAGGIGITPILSMARYLSSVGRPFRLQYFTRSVACTAFHDELTGEEFNERVHFQYALQPDAVKAYLRRLLVGPPHNAHLYVCGPKPFMDTVLDIAGAHWPPDHVHVEYFSADPKATSEDGSFEVELARSGKTIMVSEGQTIVEALESHGISVELSCEQGVCGTCLTGVLEGVPDHRDAVLTDAERAANDRMTVCVSRALSDKLVLDI